MEDRGWRATVGYPTQVENHQLQEDSGPDNDVGDLPLEQPEDDGLGRDEPPPRRSSRRNKGQTTKFQDYVSEEELAQHLPKIWDSDPLVFCGELIDSELRFPFSHETP